MVAPRSVVKSNEPVFRCQKRPTPVANSANPTINHDNQITALDCVTVVIFLNAIAYSIAYN